MKDLTEQDVAALEQQGKIGPDVANTWRAKIRQVAADVGDSAIATLSVPAAATLALGPSGLAVAPVAMLAAKTAADQRRVVAESQRETKAISALPDAAPAAAPMPTPAPGAGRGGGDYGLGGIQRGMRGVSEATGQALSDVDEQRRGAFDSRKQSIGDQAALAEQKAAEVAATQRRQAAEQERFDADMAARETERRAHLDAVAGELRKSQQEAREAKIDPDRRSGGQKALGAIGAALAGLGAGMLGSTQNVALQVIQQQIADDIAAQREEMGNKRAAVGDKASELAQLRQQFGSDRAGDEAFRAREIERYKQQVENLVSEYAAPEAKLRAEELIAQLDAEQADSQQRVITDAANTYLQSAQSQASVAGTRASLDMQRASAAGKTRQSVPGYNGEAPSPEMDKEARKIVGSNNAVQRVVGDIRAMVGKVGTEVFPSDVAKAVQTKAMMLKTALRKSGGMGSLDAGTQEFLDEMTGGDMTGFRPDAVLARLAAIAETQQTMADAELEAFGLYRAQPTAAEAREMVGAK